MVDFNEYKCEALKLLEKENQRIREKLNKLELIVQSIQNNNYYPIPQLPFHVDSPPPYDDTKIIM